jgi:hypothetical protein
MVAAAVRDWEATRLGDLVSFFFRHRPHLPLAAAVPFAPVVGAIAEVAEERERGTKRSC